MADYTLFEAIIAVAASVAAAYAGYFIAGYVADRWKAR